MTVTEEDIKSWYKIPLAQEVRDLLTPVSKDPDFVCGALACCNTKEKRQKLINEIKTKNLNTYRDICYAINEINFNRR